MSIVKVILPDGTEGVLDLDRVRSMSADQILRLLSREEKELEAELESHKKGGLPRTRLVNDIAMAKVVRILKGIGGDPRTMGTQELEAEIGKMRSELYRMSMELSRRNGDMPQPAKNVNFEKYVEE